MFLDPDEFARRIYVSRPNDLCIPVTGEFDEGMVFPTLADVDALTQGDACFIVAATMCVYVKHSSNPGDVIEFASGLEGFSKAFAIGKRETNGVYLKTRRMELDGSEVKAYFDDMMMRMGIVDAEVKGHRSLVEDHEPAHRPPPI